MQGLFIFAIILGVITVGLSAASLATRKVRAERDHVGGLTDSAFTARIVHIGAWFFLGFTLIVLFFCSANPVGTRDIGVVTSFGRLDGHVGPGLNAFSAPPWDSLTTIDDSYQLTDETFKVRIAGGQTADATVQVRWNATVPAADDIFGNYKTTKGMEKGLLDPELNKATNTALDGYDPLNAIASGAKSGTPDNPNTAQLGEAIQTLLEQEVGADIDIRTFNLQPLVYDAAVTAQINAASAQKAKTVVAQLAEDTATAQAAANKALAVNLADNPLVLVQQCMTAISNGTFKPPAGFSCWPGSGSGVVIPAAPTGK